MRTLHHCGLVVENLERSLSFYCRILDGTIEWQDNKPQEKLQADIIFGEKNCRVLTGGVRIGDTLIELFEFLEPATDRQATDLISTGWKHLAFQVSDIDEETHKLVSAGVNLRFPIQTLPNQVRIVYFEDPDGNVLEFIQPPKAQ